jgi:tetratricopeptide (TPR) repeat protein
MRCLFYIIALGISSQGVIFAQEGWVEVIKQLKHKEPALRIAAAQTLGENGVKSAVWWLMEALKDEDEPVRMAVATALKKITHIEKEFGTDYKQWLDWWNSEGIRRYYPFDVPKKEDIEKLKTEIQNIKENDLRKLQKLTSDTEANLKSEIKDTKSYTKSKIRNAERDIKTAVIIIGIVGFLFLLVIIYFAALASSKLKSWKETIKQADFYVKKGEEIKARTDKILDELEAKKVDIIEFFSKQKEENQNEIERFTELLETNLEHRMREILVELREKTEGELSHTIGEFRVQIEHEVRKMLAEFKEKIEKDSAEKEKDFKEYLESYKTFIEGSFYAAGGRLKEALRQFNKILSKNPKHFLALVNKGNILKELKRFDEAEEAYQSALELAPDDPALLYNISTLYAKSRYKDKMLYYLAKSFQNNGEYKDDALNDTSFREYWNDPAFKNLLEV